MPTTLRSFSKINLGLAIGPVREDGFHELLTVYQTLALHDRLTIEARRAATTRIVLSTSSTRVPTDAQNTVWRMVEGALERLGVAAEVHIDLEKRLPVQGGLGAGSANAAAALVGLERELGLELGAPGGLAAEERLALAAAVGSDVPLFLLGGAVLGQGRGERVLALPDLQIGAVGESAPGVPCVVAVPEIGVSTPAAFRDWDERVRRRTSVADDAPHQELTGGPGHDTLDELSLAYASAFGLRANTEAKEPDTSGTVGGSAAAKQLRSRDSLAENPLLALVRTGIRNDFEEVVFAHHSLLRSTKRLLMGCDTGMPALYAAMSGSGSALFGLYETEEAARAAQQRVEGSGVRALLTETLSRPRYWSSMFAESVSSFASDRR